MAARADVHPAAAAARAGRAGALLGALGAGSSLFVVSRLLEAWRLTPGAASHQIAILGQSLSYPAANLAALVVLGLALAGLAVTALTAGGAVRELLVDWRLRRALRACAPRPLGEVLVIDDERPRAFCAGWLRPRVYVSTGAIEQLDGAALGAVLAHERHHARRRDPLRFAAGRVMARALFFLPGLAELARRQEALAELSSDESAINAAPQGKFPMQHPAPLARRIGPRAAARATGAIALVWTGVIHLEQYAIARYSTVPTIGALFLLNFLAATALGLVLLVPVWPSAPRTRRWIDTAAVLGGLTVAAGSLAALLISEHTALFGFMEHGYRLVIRETIAVEAVAIVTLGAVLAWPVDRGGRARRGGILRNDGPLALTEGAAPAARARGGDHGGDLAP
jgi:hypothetical protein